MAHHIPSGFRILCVVFLVISLASARADGIKVFDVRNYGARGDGRMDNANAFAKAWRDACKWKGGSRFYIPLGTFYLREITFLGPCRGSISFVLKGTLLAPKYPDTKNQDTWIIFRYINNLAISGGGTLDGQGQHSWPLNDCHKNSNCRTFPMTMGFQFVKHSRVYDIRSLNSKVAHFNLFSVEDFNMTRVTIIAPDESPNTDGIKIGYSNHIRISHSNIGTGDDCVAILGGTTDIEISNIKCGPGHGVSVGSLGKVKNDKDVRRLTIKDSVFINSTNGVRIKTWESSVSKMVVSDFLYQNLRMINVGNPINIDQSYCPHNLCNDKSPSHVQIQGIKFRNIWGTSTTKEAVILKCSKSYPCKGIDLQNINLVYKGFNGPAIANCSNVQGSATGKIFPPSCIR